MRREKTTQPETGEIKKPGGSFLDTLKTLFWAFAIAMVIRSFFLEPFNIPSGSMKPTLLVGDYLFVNKMAYGYSRYSFPFGIIPIEGRLLGSVPERGDVAVFRHPVKTDVDYIKRIVGLPGDIIQVKQGILYINDRPVKRWQQEDFLIDRETQYANHVTQYEETLPNGAQHMILEIRGDTAGFDNTPAYLVPAGHFFAMGDNRDSSLDSRAMHDVGFIPMENLVGKASFFFFSVDSTVRIWNPLSWPGGIRYSRLFDGIN